MATVIDGMNRFLAAIGAGQAALSQKIKADNAYWTAPARKTQRSSTVAMAAALKFIDGTIGRSRGGLDPNGNS